MRPSQLCVLTSVVAVISWPPPDGATSTTTRKSRWQSLKPATRRSVVSLITGNRPITPPEAGSPLPEVLSPNGLTNILRRASRASSHRGLRANIFSAARLAFHLGAIDGDAIGVGELCARKQGPAIDAGDDFPDIHARIIAPFAPV